VEIRWKSKIITDPSPKPNFYFKYSGILCCLCSSEFILSCWKNRRACRLLYKFCSPRGIVFGLSRLICKFCRISQLIKLSRYGLIVGRLNLGSTNQIFLLFFRYRKLLFSYFLYRIEIRLVLCQKQILFLILSYFQENESLNFHHCINSKI
jgi:hypothetical protein